MAEAGIRRQNTSPTHHRARFLQDRNAEQYGPAKLRANSRHPSTLVGKTNLHYTADANPLHSRGPARRSSEKPRKSPSQLTCFA